jgi:hypothetical protein
MSSVVVVRAAAAGEENVLAAMGVVRRICAKAPTVQIIDQLRTATHTDERFMSIELLFATPVYRAALRTRGTAALNGRLLRECRQLRADDAAGRRWSARHYPSGYTSYGSAHRMQRWSPTFAALGRELDRHVVRFAR